MLAGITLLLLCGPGRTAPAETPPTAPDSPRTYRYRLERRVPPSLESTQKHLVAGGDAFPEEKEAEELAGRLAQLSTRLRESPSHAAEAVDPLLAAEFRGSRLNPTEEVSLGNSSRLEVFRARTMPSELDRDRSCFPGELAALVAGFESLPTAEFLVTAIEVAGRPHPLVRTTVRFDLTGAARGGGRSQKVGHWQMSWRRGADGTWRITEWTALDQVRSHAPVPVFTEVTEEAFGGDPAFRRQLVAGLDEWAESLDGLFMPRAKMGHHGLSVGDYDGDGRDDVYVSQPEGLPNRLFRNNGDGTFTDVTAAAGLGVLERTSQALFADVENDGDEDVVVLTRVGPMLFVNDGRGRFSRDSTAFQFEQRLQGTLTSGALADYDRDGFLDLYLCTYGYFIGVSEDKAGPPSPYHDALNGSPNVLFRNDGHGRFVETTTAVGLDQNNDRFSFAAAWADYDEDGWPDLFVANDFGRKNLYHHDGMVDGKPRFRDVAASAGVEDYGAGMSATFLDYDVDGHLDLYAGNMWTAAGLRVTALPGLKPDAPPEVRETYRRHARGNSLFRNRGDGTFDDVTLGAGAEFGRWAWSSDAFDFDGDGWEDLYMANGMFTRAGDGEPSPDVDSFFWRQVVAQSPLSRKAGTPYDDGWRAINRILAGNGAQAQHERNVLLRNNGRGGFDEVTGAVGLDVDQDGRSFGVFDYDADGDPDVVLFAPRSSPQLRLFRNDFAEGNATLVLRLAGTKSNRDAVGARVTVETDQGRSTRILMAGSGFLSQHSRELLFGLGRGSRILKVTIAWPSGLVQTLTDVPLNRWVSVEEGGDDLRSEPFRKGGSVPTVAAARRAEDEVVPRLPGVWLYEPFPAPDFTLRDLQGQDHALSQAGRPVLLLFWASWAPPSRAALQQLSEQREALAAAGASILAVAVDPREDEAKVREAAQGLGLPVMIATDEVAGTYSILHGSLFSRLGAQLPLPTVFLVSARREIVKIYREPIAVSQIVEDVTRIDASAEERLVRALPFPGNAYSGPGERTYFQYGLELSEQGFEGPALGAFEHVAKADPTAAAFFNLGTLYMKGGRPAQAQAAFGRALEMQPDYAEAANTLGALRAQSGDLPGAIERFRAALAARPDFPDALNNLGYAIYQTGQGEQAFELYQKALKLRPDFAEAYNNLGIYYGQGGDLDRARECFSRAVEKRPGYGEAANNLALVLGATGDVDGAITVIQRLLEQAPGFEAAYVTLARIYLQTGRQREGIQVLELLLERNPGNTAALAMLRQLRAGG